MEQKLSDEWIADRLNDIEEGLRNNKLFRGDITALILWVRQYKEERDELKRISDHVRSEDLKRSGKLYAQKKEIAELKKKVEEYEKLKKHLDEHSNR